MKTKFLVVGDKNGAPYCEFYAYCDDKLVFHTRGTVGRNGVSEDRVEGDGTTPIGTFKMGKCFGLLHVPESIKMDLECLLDIAPLPFYNMMVRGE